MKKEIDEVYTANRGLLKQLEKQLEISKYWKEKYKKLAQTFKGCEGKYGTYEELSKKYEDLWSDYRSLSAILDTQVGRLAYQNMMLDKAREAYKYITSEDRDHFKETNK